MKPGCFGLSISSGYDLSLCRSCQYRSECGSESGVFADRIANNLTQIELGEILRKRQKKSKGSIYPTRSAKNLLVSRVGFTEEQHSMLAIVRTRYSKAERLMRHIFKNRIDIRESLRKGVNPYLSQDSHSYMVHVLDLLLKDGGFTRSELRRTLIYKMNWTEGTANSHVLICIHTLKEIGVISEQEDNYRLRG